MSLSPVLCGRLALAGLLPDQIEHIVRAALEEDLAGGVDVTSVAIVPVEQQATADLVVRTDGVIAGLPVAAAVFEVASEGAVSLGWHGRDGNRVSPGTVVLTAQGPTRSLLMAERTALNLLGRLSGVATLTRRWVEAVAGTGARVRDTRKTTPGLRALEKYAVRCGGGLNHRMSLTDAALVKDNHVVAAGGVRAAFDAVRRMFPDVPVEVEVDTVEQCAEAVAAGSDLVLLDNMSLDDLRAAVAVTGGRARLEASGGLTLDTARAVADTGIDYLAVGALTHSAPQLDIGCDLRPVSRSPAAVSATIPATEEA